MNPLSVTRYGVVGIMPDFQGSRENGFINTVIFFSVEVQVQYSDGKGFIQPSPKAGLSIFDFVEQAKLSLRCSIFALAKNEPHSAIRC